jgi:hypothetical protein
VSYAFPMGQVLTLFCGMHFSEIEQHQITLLTLRIKGEDEQYLLNVNEDDYLDHLVSDFAVEPLEADFAAAFATDEERLIPAEDCPPTTFVNKGQRYLKRVFTFHVPFSGALGLLQAIPSSRLVWTQTVRVDRDKNLISFEATQFSERIEPVNDVYDDFVKNMKAQLQNLRTDVDRFNTALKTRGKQIFDSRKTELKKAAEFRTALKVPIRRSVAPATYSVPVKSPKRIVPRPVSSAESYKIDPTMDLVTYQEILQLIHDFGKQLERLPGTYENKNEETLRDHFLLMLQPHFGVDGSATGETFNASGKTDILVRYQNQNIFVAEFKFWKGAKQHQETIDQLLSYLTWRDSKTAIVYFIDGKEISVPLLAIQERTPEHPCYVALTERKEDSWFSYEFHMVGDVNKKVKVAILCFHLPK